MNRWEDNPRTEKQGAFHTTWLPSLNIFAVILLALVLFAGCTEGSEADTIPNENLTQLTRDEWSGSPEIWLASAEGHTYVVVVGRDTAHIIHSEGCASVHQP